MRIETADKWESTRVELFLVWIQTDLSLHRQTGGLLPNGAKTTLAKGQKGVHAQKPPQGKLWRGKEVY